MAKTPRNDHGEVVRKINATLQGPVVDVLGELVPEVRRLPKRGALEVILDDVELLNRCFIAFRGNPDRFRHLLINRHKVSVEDAEALLECGRSLDQVIAMVVRTAAKRHFRGKLDGSTKALRAKPGQRAKRRRGLLSRLRAFLSTPQRPPERPRTRGEVLYDAFQEYLRHDWQVPIIPEYCNLTPGTVRRLGARILDYRIPEDIRRLRADPDNPPPPTPVVEVASPAAGQPNYQLPSFLTQAKPGQSSPGSPTAITTADARASDGMAKLDYAKTEAKDERARLSDILTPDGKRLKPGAFTIVLLDPKVRAHLPNSEQTVRITGILGAVNGLVGKMLVGELGFRMDQLAVFLMAAHGALGDARFEKAFGIPGHPDYAAKIVERAKAVGLGQKSELKQIADFVTKTFAAAEAAQKAKK